MLRLIETDAAGCVALEQALARAEADLRVASGEYNLTDFAVRDWKAKHPQLDVTRIYNGAAYTIVNAHIFASSMLNELCARREKAQRRFHEALRVRTDAMRQLNLIS